MSLAEHRPLASIFVRAVSILAMGLGLCGCFQPLYGPLSAGGNVAGELQAIAVDPIPGRIGHYLGNELIFALNGTGAKVPAKYHLSVLVVETVQTPLLDTVTGYPSAASVVVNADYRLMPVGGGEPVATGRATTLASYDRTSQRFANLRAARDAGIRDAKTLAEQIKTRIAAALAAGR